MSRNKTILIVVGVLAILVIAGVLASQSKRNSATNPSAQASADMAEEVRDEQNKITAQEEADRVDRESASPKATEAVSSPTVTYTNSGFSNSNITVKAGTTVTFTNNSDTSLWVASDPHPTHTGLAGFDSLKGMSKGQSYSFTFTKAGTYTYHNHLDPTDKGTVTVE